jgi:hypothetical protein
VSENKEKDNTILLLYSTSGCHLCDLAKGLIDEALLEQRFTLKVVDIANDDQLFEMYGVHIPVVKYKHSLQALYWPFSLEELTEYLLVLRG